MARRPTDTISLKLAVPNSSVTETVTEDKGIKGSTSNKTKSTTENTSIRDIPVVSQSVANQQSTHPNHGGAEGSGVPRNSGSKHRTRDINRGPGAGASNEGNKTGAINKHNGVVNFGKITKEEIESRDKSGGNINIGTGAGADNIGDGAGSINEGEGTVNF